MAPSTGASHRCQTSGAMSNSKSMKETTEAGIGEAFDRIEDFIAVQGSEISTEAVNLLQESVGIDDETRATFRDRVEAPDSKCRPGRSFWE